MSAQSRVITLREKLRAITLSAVITALLVAAVAFVLVDYYTYRSSKVEQLKTLSRVVASNSAAAVAFNDEAAASEFAGALAKLSGVRELQIAQAAGEVLVSFNRDGGASLLDTLERPSGAYDAPVHVYVGDSVAVWAPVMPGAMGLGAISLV
ncbi:MAG: CHASE sensor domain-containing protein [Maricaulaceae bacterium]